jgi:hypothetical protein
MLKLRTACRKNGHVAGTTEDMAQDLTLFHTLLPVLDDLIEAVDVAQGVECPDIGREYARAALDRYQALEARFPWATTVHLYVIPDQFCWAGSKARG